MDTKTRELQLKLLEVMKIFHLVCENNNLKYYMVNGTILGAIRHGGFIPWDDDMDIGMPRKDYEKLIKLSPDHWPSNIHIKTPYNSNDLIFPFIKVMDKTTTIVEDRLDGIVEGIYIDIFPLDGAGNNTFFAKLRYYVFYWKKGLLFNNQDHEDKKTFLRRLVQRYARQCNVNRLLYSAENWMKKKSYSESEIVGNFPGSWGFKEFMVKGVMGTPTLYKFEDTEFYGPEKAMVYLKSLYGDFMSLPPVHQRKSHHKLKYMNLNLPFEKYREIE
jgi:lipopolysaccharide cholinephosphotransferase